MTLDLEEKRGNRPRTHKEGLGFLQEREWAPLAEASAFSLSTTGAVAAVAHGFYVKKQLVVHGKIKGKTNPQLLCTLGTTPSSVRQTPPMPRPASFFQFYFLSMMLSASTKSGRPESSFLLRQGFFSTDY